MRFTRIEVATKMKETGMVPLFYNSDLELCKEVTAACYRGGSQLLEFTARGDFAHEVFSGLSKYIAAELPDMAIGVGSITDSGQASLYMAMGADFIVTPTLREDIAIACNRRKVLWSPGCATLGEISRAEELGCEIVKLFPGATYGAGFVKAIKGPCPWTSIMPTGGVSTERDNLKAWFDAGVTCVGMGSKLISKELVQSRDFVKLENNVRETLALIKELRR
ncbi:MAG: 2-dehydro-3-deoxyphosphogluconate aldolase/(4S)-4-hydroxy-2-oxoglutarate aldolase [Saprospiraceae bacterium]|jgi:2-dehydro-3-deoxyphosphogluconate aldolase/(4S)-4-hydroxy-2-oxoglutarate aldolase